MLQAPGRWSQSSIGKHGTDGSSEIVTNFDKRRAQKEAQFERLVPDGNYDKDVA